MRLFLSRVSSLSQVSTCQRGAGKIIEFNEEVCWKPKVDPKNPQSLRTLRTLMIQATWDVLKKKHVHQCSKELPAAHMISCGHGSRKP